MYARDIGRTIASISPRWYNIFILNTSFVLKTFPIPKTMDAFSTGSAAFEQAFSSYVDFIENIRFANTEWRSTLF